MLMSSQFIKSAADQGGYPVSRLPELAIVGRSNAGKSSFINAIAKRKSLARVSSTPGKTDLLNFYEIDAKFMLVDMPGYGYAARSEVERKKWSPMIETYLQTRENLRGVALIFDINRPWSQDEASLVDWLDDQGVKVILVLNKVDKLNQKELNSKKREFAEIPGVIDTIFTSAAKGQGIDTFIRSVFENMFRA